jgi:energy-coupling factor transport system ATP-binding protein
VPCSGWIAAGGVMSIHIENLSHVVMRGTPVEKTVLCDITLDIERGSFVGIVGRSGSGKSTLVQHLNGLLKATSGKITVNGLDVAPGKLGELRRQVGMVFQFPEQQLFEETVYRDIAFGLSTSGMSSAETDTRVKEALKTVGLGEEFLGKSPFRLSGGEKRRVAIAGVLVMDPCIIVLDEPAAGLDPGGRREILDFVAKLSRERGMTVLLVSHDTDDIIRLADKAVVLKNGRIAMNGPTREVFGNVSALEDAGLAPPRITSFMMALKKKIPEINDRILTVEEAREELKGFLLRKKIGLRPHDEGYSHRPVSSRQIDYSQVGPENEDFAVDRFYDACISG